MDKYHYLYTYERFTKAIVFLAILSLMVLIFTVMCLGVFTIPFIVAYVVCANVLESFLLVVFTPLIIGSSVIAFRSWLNEELARAIDCGFDKYLWVESTPFDFGKFLYKPVLQESWTMSEPFFKPLMDSLLDFELITPETARMSYEVAASRSYCHFIQFMSRLFESDVSYYLVVFYAIMAGARLYRRVIDRIAVFVYVCIPFLSFIYISEAHNVVNLVVAWLHFIDTITEPEFWIWLKWRVTWFAVQMTLHFVNSHFIGLKYSSPKVPGGLTIRNFKTSANAFLMKVATTVHALGLPSYIRNSRQETYSLEDTLQIMKDLGWPINVDLEEPNLEIVPQQWKEWVLCGSSFKQGINNMKVFVDRDLDFLRVKHMAWVRTEQYGSVKNELESTARYFRSPRYDFPDLDLDDVWYIVKDIFQNSQITPFNYIISKWNKRFSLGSFMTRNAKSKIKRSTFINSIGYKNFKILWRKTFEIASLLTPTSAVRIKDEALPYSKFLNDKVRTVIGSPISQYIMSTIWNYEPNHRFRFKDTPIKVGMPLNGASMSEIYIRHARCQHHVAGDMTAFDSTLSYGIKDLIKAVRKKGFENHKDFERICHLIDVNYDQVASQLLNTTSTGNIYKKGTGLTTGHSSTSSDNSLGLVILYVMAWKELTGLSAKEFLFYNELSNFGDDHILSFLSIKPAAWNFKNIQKVMAKWGVINRKEAEGKLENIPFLSKYCRKPTAAEKENFAKNGITLPAYIVYHDKERLVGKLLAPVRSMAPGYRLKRLLSYLDLTAHHYDIYSSITRTINRSFNMKMLLKKENLTIPSYDSIMRKWYTPNAKYPVFGLETDLNVNPEELNLYTYGQVTLLDSILGAISLIPDAVNPAIFNHGYVRAFQGFMAKWLQWPIEMLVAQNNVVSTAELRNVLRASDYGFLDYTIYGGQVGTYNKSTLFVRHWLFSYFYRNFKTPSFGNIINVISVRLSSLQYLINAVVPTHITNYKTSFQYVVLCTLLNFVVVPPFFDFISLVVIPRPDKILDLVFHYFTVFFWASLPPNFNDINAFLDEIGNRSLLIEAPTGTGKSTTLIYHLSNMLGSYNKIIVVECRVNLATGLSKYMNETFQMSTGSWAQGFRSNPDARVEYVTPMEALLHYGDLSKQNAVWVLDEAHITEGSFMTLGKVLRKDSKPLIGLTGTPSALNLEEFDLHIPLAISKLWSISDRKFDSQVTSLQNIRMEYENFVLNQVMNCHPKSKILVFYPWAKKSRFGDRIPYKVSYLHSKSNDTSGQVILSTSVADVGITIPDVDVVITPEFDFTSIVTDDVPSVKLVKLPPMTLLQRRGRTGRTNNGTFVKFNTPNVRYEAVLNDKQISDNAFYEAIVGGLAPDLITTHYPDQAQAYCQRILGREPEPEELTEMISGIRDYLEDIRVLRIIRDSVTDFDKDFVDDWASLDPARGGDWANTSNKPTEDLITNAFKEAADFMRDSYPNTFGSTAKIIVDITQAAADIKRAVLINRQFNPFEDITVPVA